MRIVGVAGVGDGSDEAVAAAGEGFDEARVVGGVAEGFADLVDGGGEGVVEVDVGVVAPEVALELLAGDDFAGTLEEIGEHFEGLALELDAVARSPEFSRSEVDFVETEGDARSGTGALHSPAGFCTLPSGGVRGPLPLGVLLVQSLGRVGVRGRLRGLVRKAGSFALLRMTSCVVVLGLSGRVKKRVLRFAQDDNSKPSGSFALLRMTSCVVLPWA